MEGDGSRLEDEMRVIAEESPGVAGCVGVRKDFAHPFDKAIPVDIVTEDQAPLDTADDDMMENAFGVQTGMAWRGQSSQHGRWCVKS
jgi:hypothetical protein